MRRLLRRHGVERVFRFSLSARHRSRGRRAFIWGTGVRSFGIVIALPMGAFIAAEQARETGLGSLLDWRIIAALVGSMGVTALVGGYLWGAAMWYLGTHE